MSPTLRPPLLAALLAAAVPAVAGCADQTPARGDSGSLPTVDGTFRRIDEGADEPGFAALRDSLTSIITRRDTAALLATVAEGAKLSFGDDAGGPDGLRAMWFSGAPPEGVSLWHRLGSLLASGSVVMDEAVIAPYVPGSWPADSVDVFTHVAIVPARDVPVEARSAPADSAEVVALVRDIILPREGTPAGGYQGVRLPDGATVYVPEGRAMSPVGWRATFFPDAAGAWKLQTLVAGD